MSTIQLSPTEIREPGSNTAMICELRRLLKKYLSRNGRQDPENPISILCRQIVTSQGNLSDDIFTDTEAHHNPLSQSDDLIEDTKNIIADDDVNSYPATIYSSLINVLLPLARQFKEEKGCGGLKSYNHEESDDTHFAVAGRRVSLGRELNWFSSPRNVTNGKESLTSQKVEQRRGFHRFKSIYEPHVESGFQSRTDNGEQSPQSCFAIKFPSDDHDRDLMRLRRLIICSGSDDIQIDESFGSTILPLRVEVINGPDSASGQSSTSSESTESKNPDIVRNETIENTIPGKTQTTSGNFTPNIQTSNGSSHRWLRLKATDIVLLWNNRYSVDRMMRSADNSKHVLGRSIPNVILSNITAYVTIMEFLTGKTTLRYIKSTELYDTGNMSGSPSSTVSDGDSFCTFFSMLEKYIDAYDESVSASKLTFVDKKTIPKSISTKRVKETVLEMDASSLGVKRVMKLGPKDDLISPRDVEAKSSITGIINGVSDPHLRLELLKAHELELLVELRRLEDLSRFSYLEECSIEFQKQILFNRVKDHRQQ